jgi:peptidoglycan glycosyltransferase
VNRAIRRWSIVMLVLFTALLGNITFIQAFWADELNARSDNRRVLLEEYARQRGPILVDDEAVARSQATGGLFEYRRSYPEPELYAHATGYYSWIYGRSATERVANDILAGTDDALFARRLIDLVAGRAPEGGSVRLTLLPEAQRAAYEGLQGKAGAVVALDPSTGAILAMVSSPSYDPNPLAHPNSETQEEAWTALETDPDDPGLNRAIARTYPPGSVFKLITAAAALESGEYDPDSPIPGPAQLQLPGSTSVLPNATGTSCGPDDTTTLAEALRISCNTAFALVGIDIGDDVLREQAEAFGYNSQPLAAYNAATSVFPSNLDPAQTAQASIGQYDVRSTALQTAMVSAAIANNGTLMAPYLIAEALAPDLDPLRITEPEEQSDAVSRQTARELTEMMVEVVDSGTGTNAAIAGVSVAGKTGTAERGPQDPPIYWFTSFAPAESPEVAVAVVIEDAGDELDISGGRLAAPVARAVMQAVLLRGGTQP